MAEQAKAGDTVEIHYTGRLEDGTVFDSSRGRGDPLSFEVGSGAVIPGFDNAVDGMSVGEQKTVEIEAENAYGDRRPDLQVDVPREQFPATAEPEEGMQVSVQVAEGQTAVARIVEVEEEKIKLDLNHPLAGEKLIFDIELVGIQ